MARLYVVATPIGNLSDMSGRVRETLAECDLIAAEDTRVTMKLLNVLGISKPMTSCHQHNEVGKAQGLVERMIREDLKVALTCDAGTPGISDPGGPVVEAAWKNGVEVVPVCGPSAVVTALSASGFDTREFAFYGFLPREKRELRDKLEAILRAGVEVAVLYESPHRVVKLVEEIVSALPGVRMLVCCDLTKRYEKLLRGEGEAVLRALRENPNVEKGEYCLVLDLHRVPQPQAPQADIGASELILQRMMEGETLDQAARSAMDQCSRNEVYKAKLKVRTFLERYLEEEE